MVLKDLKLPEDIHYLLRIESAKRKLNLYQTVEKLIHENQELKQIIQEKQ